MSTFQKCVKYFALFLAFSILFSIASAIFSSFYFLTSFFGESTKTEDMREIVTIEEDIRNLKVSLKGTSFRIVEGEKISLWSNRGELDYQVSNGNLVITENENLWNYDHQVTLSLPKGKVFDDVKLENGAGKVEIDSLNTKKVDFEMGAGKTIFHHLTVANSAKIEGGAGALELNDATIHNLDFDMGVGKVDISGNILGHSNINGGVGKVTLRLDNKLDFYTLDMKKGISSILLNHENITSDMVYGSGENYMKVESGVGTIEITTTEEGAF